MLGKYAAAYVVIVEAINSLISKLDSWALQNNSSAADTDTDRLYLALIGKEPKLPDEFGQNISDVLNNLLKHVSSRMAFPSVAAQGRRVSEAIKSGSGPKALSAQIQELKTRLKDELNECEFLYIPPERVRFYKEPMLFGREVNDRFPLAIDDIEEAGKCLSLSQGTACVLHTMRVMEVGLKALAKALGIPYAPSWESYLTQISSNIAKKHASKSSKWKRDEKFYRDLSGDLLTVKQAWRNPTMHVDRKYSVEEAEQIFLASKNFMMKLALHFTQKEMERLLK